MTSYPINDFDRIRQEKFQIYQDFLTATVLLKGALQNEEMARATRLLAEREKLAALVDRLDQRLRRHEQPTNFTPHLAGRNRPDKVADALQEILRSIIAANAECDALAANKSAELKNNILMIRQTEAGVHSYAAQPQRQPVFLNVRS